DAPFDLVAGDFTGKKYADGRPVLDLAVTDTYVPDPSVPFYVSVLLNKYEFNNPARYYLSGNTPLGIVAGNFSERKSPDGTPVLDLATANVGSGNVSILLGSVTGDGSFTETANPDGNLPAVGSSPQFLVAGNFTGSGHLDLAVANR